MFSTQNSKILTNLLQPNTELKITFVYDGKREIIPEKDIFISAHIIEVELKKKFCSG
jgi:hypothetical protein